MNLLPVSREGNRLRLSGALSWTHRGPMPRADRMILGVRPEKLRLAGKDAGPIPVAVAVIEKLGAETVVGCRPLTGSVAGEAGLIEHDLLFVRISGTPRLAIEERLSLDYDPADVVWFDERTGVRLGAEMPALQPSLG
jgi:multiple sugar transport system ATP-binding protein